MAKMLMDYERKLKVRRPRMRLGGQGRGSEAKDEVRRTRMRLGGQG